MANALVEQGDQIIRVLAQNLLVVHNRLVVFLHFPVAKPAVRKRGHESESFSVWVNYLVLVAFQRDVVFFEVFVHQADF